MSVHFTILLAFAISRPEASPPEDTTECVTDSSAESTLGFARNLMTSPDSFMAGECATYELQRLRESQVEIVHTKAVCERAAEAYAHRFGPGASLDVHPERIVVVEAGDYYFVENMSPGENGQIHDENFWEIQLFTKQWRPVISFGQGS
jgi:hypothetical protein